MKNICAAAFRDVFPRAKCISLLLFVILAPHVTVFAQTIPVKQEGAPRTLSYQGVIAGVDAPIADGKHRITISLYADPAGSSSIWTSTYTPLVTNGVFEVMLGSDKPLPEPATLDRQLWIGISVDDGAELRPFTQLSASAYSLNVADKSVTTGKLADKAVTSEKIGADYVRSITVNGQKIAKNAADVNFVAGNGLQMDYDAASGTVVLGARNQGSMGKGDKPLWVNKGTGGLTGNGCTTNTDGSIAYNTVGGGCGNSADTSVGYATIAGGLDNEAHAIYSTVAGGNTNIIKNQTHHNSGTPVIPPYSSDGSFIGGGDHNTIDGVPDAVIAGGHANTISNPDDNTGSNPAIGYNLIGSGYENIISTSISNVSGYSPTYSSTHNWVQYATILGGIYNHNAGYLATILGGWENSILGGQYNGSSIIGGGQQNLVNGHCSAILGGAVNTIGSPSTSYNASIIGGGYANTIEGAYSAIAGGAHLTIGDNSFGFSGNTAITTGSPVDISGAVGPNGVAGQIAYLGDVDLWLGNYDPYGGIPSTMKFWSSNSSLDYTGSTFIGLTAPASLSSSGTYTLPPLPSSTGLVLTSSTSGGMSWATVGAMGSVTSVGLSLPAEFSVSGSPVTSSGTLTGAWVNENPNYVFAGPASGSAGTPSFRLLVAADIPNLDASKITTGTINKSFITGFDPDKVTFGDPSGSAGASGLVQSTALKYFSASGLYVNNHVKIDNGKQLQLSDGTNASTFHQPSGGAAIDYTLPATAPASGDVLTAGTPTATNLKWAAPTVTASNITGFDPDKITFGDPTGSTGTSALVQSANLKYTSGAGLYVNNDVTIDNGQALRIENSGGNGSSFVEPSSANTIDYVLPPTLPTTTGDEVLTATRVGATSTVNLSWAPPSTSGGAFSGWLLNGNGLAASSTPYVVGSTSTSASNSEWVMQSHGTTMGYLDATNSNVTFGSGTSIDITTTPATQASTVGGGTANTISGKGKFSTIAGGTANQILSEAGGATIGGGDSNRILKSGTVPPHMYGNYATIPGGRGLIANSFGQIVTGSFNNTKATNVIDLSSTSTGGGSFAPGPQSDINNNPNPGPFANPGINPAATANTSLSNGILFAIGNGTGDKAANTTTTTPTTGTTPSFGPTTYGSATSGISDSGYRHNAFEVSYNGHATPTGILGEAKIDLATLGSFSGTIPQPSSPMLDQTNGPVKGAYYNDNSLLAWGDIPEPSGTFSSVAPNNIQAVTPTASFGVVSAVWYWPNICIITTNYYPGQSTPTQIDPEYTRQSVVASIQDHCDPNVFTGLLTVSPYVPAVPDCDWPLKRNQFRVTTWQITPKLIYTLKASVGGGVFTSVSNNDFESETVAQLEKKPRRFYFHMTGR